MSWTDEELDKLFSDSAGEMTFEYKKEYFRDIEKHLPISKKRDILWTGMTLLMGSIVVYLMIQPVNTVMNGSMMSHQLAQNTEQSSEVFAEKLNTSISEEELSQVVPRDLSLSTLNSVQTNTSDSYVTTGDIDESATSFEEVAKTEVPSKSLEVNSISSIDLGQDENTLSQLDAELLNTKALNQELMAAGPQIDRIDVTPGLDFFVQGVAGIGQGKMLPGEKVSKITGLGVGVELNRRKLTASFALNGVISHHEGMELSRISKVYGFGSTEYKSTIEYSKLFLAESELTLGYRMGRFTAFSGVNVNYLVTTESTVSSFENEKMNTLDVRKLYGYKTGLKNWGLKPMVGLSYDFKNRIQLGANFGAQVIQTVEPDYLEGTSRPLPLEGRLYLRLKL